MPRSGRRATGAARLALVLVAVAAGLTGCTAERDSPTVHAPTASAAATAGSAPTPARSAGAAVRADLARFDAIARRTVASDPEAGGRDFVDALVAGGFRKADMQVTEDRTTIGLAVPSVQFSVLRRGVCLVGQHGPGSDGYRSAAVEPADGRCLIGRTRTIDW